MSFLIPGAAVFRGLWRLRWGKPICPWVGVSCLMSAVTLSVDVCSAGNVLRLLSFADHLFFSKWLRFSNTDEENTEMCSHFRLVKRLFWA